MSTDPDACRFVLADFYAACSTPRSEVPMPTLRVSASSRPNAVAGAVAALLRLEGVVEMQAIGPHAVNQAVKSLAIARSYLVQDRLDLVAAPAFVKLELHDEERTAMRFEVRAVPIGEAPAPTPASGTGPGGAREPAAPGEGDQAEPEGQTEAGRGAHPPGRQPMDGQTDEDEDRGPQTPT